MIENDENAIEGCRAVMKKLMYIQGDATDDENLVAAGIEKAAGVIGARRLNNEIDLNPHPTFIFKEGMTLIVMGMADDIAKAKSAY